MNGGRATRRRVFVALLPILLVAGALAPAACGSTKASSTGLPSPPSSVAVGAAQSTPVVTPDVEYGSNKTFSGSTKRLTLDLYEPPVGPEEKRPLLILLPGGGFQPEMTDKSQLAGLATEIARHDCVVACINYRTYNGSKAMTEAALRAAIVQGMQDAKAAVRFFRKDAATADRYGIDPARIFLGGHSAGAVDSGQAVYLDNLSKADPDLRTIITAQGGLEGDSGNGGYDSSVAGWINLAGALDDEDWITPSSNPMLCVYGTNDSMVSPKKGNFVAPKKGNFGGDSVFSGARSLYERAMAVGLTASQIYAIEGGDHFAPVDASNSELISRLVRFIESLS